MKTSAFNAQWEGDILENLFRWSLQCLFFIIKAKWHQEKRECLFISYLIMIFFSLKETFFFVFSFLFFKSLILTLLEKYSYITASFFVRILCISLCFMLCILLICLPNPFSKYCQGANFLYLFIFSTRLSFSLPFET